jgi:hypothetical protein
VSGDGGGAYLPGHVPRTTTTTMSSSVVFAVADSEREWEGEGGYPGWSVVVSGEERWWGGGLTCSRAPNDNEVVVVALLSLTAGAYGGERGGLRGSSGDGGVAGLPARVSQTTMMSSSSYGGEGGGPGGGSGDGEW